MSSLDRYFDFNTATAENPASHKYDVGNGSNIRKNPNPKSEYEEKCIRSEESDG
ncbi:Hypothetical protein CINCED_3A015933 [Cinara cedri]|uniref:Uncharacterized protein n=1 Tax=Cinara cedri TaxID=506608 RepID=A0A5E4NIW2_9HEMI|nr:Hypothetical protein CINCED_3A015933 [Cinara cedri]